MSIRDARRRIISALNLPIIPDETASTTVDEAAETGCRILLRAGAAEVDLAAMCRAEPQLLWRDAASLLGSSALIAVVCHCPLNTFAQRLCSSGSLQDQVLDLEVGTIDEYQRLDTSKTKVIQREAVVEMFNDAEAYRRDLDDKFNFQPLWIGTPGIGISMSRHIVAHKRLCGAGDDAPSVVVFYTGRARGAQPTIVVYHSRDSSLAFRYEPTTAGDAALKNDWETWVFRVDRDFQLTVLVEVSGADEGLPAPYLEGAEYWHFASSDDGVLRNQTIRSTMGIGPLMWMPHLTTADVAAFTAAFELDADRVKICMGKYGRVVRPLFAADAELRLFDEWMESRVKEATDVTDMCRVLTDNFTAPGTLATYAPQHDSVRYNVNPEAVGLDRWQRERKMWASRMMSHRLTQVLLKEKEQRGESAMDMLLQETERLQSEASTGPSMTGFNSLQTGLGALLGGAGAFPAGPLAGLLSGGGMAGALLGHRAAMAGAFPGGAAAGGALASAFLGGALAAPTSTSSDFDGSSAGGAGAAADGATADAARSPSTAGASPPARGDDAPPAARVRRRRAARRTRATRRKRTTERNAASRTTSSTTSSSTRKRARPSP